MNLYAKELLSRTILSAKAATGFGTAQFIADFQNVNLTLVTAGSATLTVKLQGALTGLASPPDFTAAASATNPWFYVASYDLNDTTLVVPGATGYSAAGSDLVKGIRLATKGLNWLNGQVTSRSAGSATLTLMASNNA